jgi:hypothetical protein
MSFHLKLLKLSLLKEKEFFEPDLQARVSDRFNN